MNKFITILVLVTEHSGIIGQRSGVFEETYSANEAFMHLHSVRFLNNILNNKLILGQVHYDAYMKVQSTTYAFFHCGTSAGYQVTHLLLTSGLLLPSVTMVL